MFLSVFVRTRRPDAVLVQLFDRKTGSCLRTPNQGAEHIESSTIVMPKSRREYYFCRVDQRKVRFFFSLPLWASPASCACCSHRCHWTSTPLGIHYFLDPSQMSLNSKSGIRTSFISPPESESVRSSTEKGKARFNRGT